MAEPICGKVGDFLFPLILFRFGGTYNNLFNLRIVNRACI